VSAVALAPEATDGIRAAQNALEQQAARLAAVGDPIAPAISAIASAVGAQNRLAVDAFLKTGKLMEDGRKPWGREEMQIMIKQLDETLLHRWTAFNRAGIAIGVGVALIFGAICGAGGWWAHSPPTELACGDQADGSRICWMYTRLPVVAPKR
jgi:hypothetical protein